MIVQAGAFAEHTIEAVRYTACEDGSWLGDLYDYGHGEPAVTERRADVGGPWLTVHLPASTRVRLTLRLALRDPDAVLRESVRRAQGAAARHRSYDECCLWVMLALIACSLEDRTKRDRYRQP